MFRRYGSNLPTSLTYIVQLPEAVHLGDLMRIWVRPATKIIMPCSDFQGPTRAFRTPQDGWCFTKASPLSPDNPIPGGGCTSNKEERTLPRTLADVSEVGCVTALDTNLWNVSISVGRVGNINPIPFRYRGIQYTSLFQAPLLCTDLPDHLGPPDPWPTAVPMEPFSTSAFKVLT